LRLKGDGEVHIKVEGALDMIPEQVEEKPLNLLCGILCGKNSDETGLAGVENYIDFSFRNNRYSMTIPADTLLFDEYKNYYTISEKKVIDLGVTGKRMVIYNKNNGEFLLKDHTLNPADNYLIVCIINEVTNYKGTLMVSINTMYTINGFFLGSQSLANSLTNIVPTIAWQYGDISGGKITTSAKRLVSTDILCYDQDLVLKKNEIIHFYLWEYADAVGNSPTIKGTVNKNEDYIIKAGTYFRLVILNVDGSIIYLGNFRNTDLITKSRIYIKNELDTICDFGAMHLNYLYNENIKSIAHRGANKVAPENTIPAFAEAKKMGFNYIEADLAWSSDNVPVILHDTTIDRTSNGTGDVSSKTLAELKSLDFGSWYSSKFAGVQIPTFEELLIFCRGVGLKIYIELRTSTREQIAIAVRMAKKMGMIDNITWISVSEVVLGYVVEEYSKARVGIVTTSINSTTISNALSLKTEQNSVFIDSSSTTDAEIEMCIDAGLELESWDYWTEESIINLPPYITGITSDNLVAGKVLYKHYL
jgi:glycerophosphoryl diester phosphodiesterase